MRVVEAFEAAELALVLQHDLEVFDDLVLLLRLMLVARAIRVC